MNWQKLLNSRQVRPHQTSPAELAQLRAVVARDMSDALVAGLSADRRFTCLYSAALQLAHMAIACSGYRVAATAGHHKTSFECLELAMGSAISSYAVYFDACRRKPNLVEYDSSSVATETEVAELITRVREFEERVEQWIEQRHPLLARRKP